MPEHSEKPGRLSAPFLIFGAILMIGLVGVTVVLIDYFGGDDESDEAIDARPR